jgi:hypothetical protein
VVIYDRGEEVDMQI